MNSMKIRAMRPRERSKKIVQVEDDIQTKETVRSASWADLSYTAGLVLPDELVSLYEEGIDQYNKGMCERARRNLIRALNLASKKFPRNSALISVLKLEVSKVLYHFQEYKQSAETFLGAEDVIEGLNKDEFIKILKEIIKFQENQENLVHHYQRIIQMGFQLLGKEHPDIATAYQALANVYCDREDYAHALPYLKSALKILLAISNNEDKPEISSLLFTLGRANYHMDQYKSALKYFQSSLAMDVRLFGTKHSDLASTHLLIGVIFLQTSRLDDALSSLSKALMLRDKSNPAHHEELSTIFHRMGVAYTRQKNFQGAEKAYVELLALQKSLLQTDIHPQIAETWITLGNIHMSRRYYDRAVHAFLQELHIKRKLLGNEDPDVAISLIGIGDVYDTYLNELQSALSVYKEAYRIAKSSPKPISMEGDTCVLKSLQVKIGRLLDEIRSADLRTCEFYESDEETI